MICANTTRCPHVPLKIDGTIMGTMVFACPWCEIERLKAEVARLGGENAELKARSRAVGFWKGNTLWWRIGDEEVSDRDLRAWCELNLPERDRPWSRGIQQRDIEAYAKRKSPAPADEESER